ncbi:sugar transporter, partial [Methylorubrum sp. POS3]
NRDLLYVSSAPFSEVAKVLSVVSTIASPVGSAASIYTVTR